MNAMKKYSVWKWLVLAALVSVSLMLILPGQDASDLREWLNIKGGIRKGLDISGGTSFTLEIDQSKIDIKAIEERIRQNMPGITTNQLEAEVANEIQALPQRALEIIRNRVDGLGIAEPVIFLQKGKSSTKIIVQLPGIDDKKRQEAEDVLKSAAYLELRLVHEKNEQLLEKLFADSCPPPPGYLKVTATEDRKFYVINLKDVPAGDRNAEFLAKQKRFKAPPDADFLLEKEEKNGREEYVPCFVEKKVQLVGSGIRLARRERDPTFGQYGVSFQLAGEAKKKFATVTKKYARKGDVPGRRLAIVLDGTLVSAPEIRTPIPDGRGEITGRFSFEEASKLATVLQTGALDAPIMIGEKRVVDPTLGADSVSNGVLAGILGCVAIVVLMAGYYLFPGLLADMALILNVVLLPIGMILVAGFLGVLTPEARAGAAIALPVLTLPGIAGIALTIGMAVDANVLIFERMREELRTGKGFAAVVQAGFDKAFSAIFDSNITTIITAVILFVFGSGPVRGYAVTLTGGLIVSLYTSVFVTRMCFNLIGTRTEKLSFFRMLNAIKPTAIDFIRWWKPAVAMSVLIIAGSFALMAYNYRKDESKVLGVDFTGGSSVTMSFSKGKEPDVEAVRKTLSAAGVPDAAIQYQKSANASSPELLQIRVGKLGGGAPSPQAATNHPGSAVSSAQLQQTNEVAQSATNIAPAAATQVAGAAPPSIEQDNVVVQALLRRFPDAGFKLLQQDYVGAQVSKDLGRNARTAMILALIGMVVYIALRFKFGFALGAVVATFHDGLVTLGLMHVFGFQITMTVLAAVLTIIGYSVNDTIVIFDRIREDLRLYRNKTFLEICNQAINETLSRTLLTNSLTFVSILFLLFLGGESLRDFSVAMFIGMISGTYSTVYIATPVVLLWYRRKRPDLGKTVKIG